MSTAAGFESISTVGARPFRSRTRDVALAEMAIGTQIWETWNRISYQVFEAIVRDQARQAGETGAQAQNTWLCVPQLIANLACLVGVVSVTKGPKTIITLVGDELRQWENSLHAVSKPGMFTLARRIIIHPKFTKSYGYHTFVTLNNLAVEMKIYDSPSEILQWIQKNLRLSSSLLTCPFKLWRGGEGHIKKDVIIKDTLTRDLAKTNHKCPIFAWASHFQVAFKSGIFESEVVFTKSGVPDHKDEEMYVRFHSEKPKMRQCSAGRATILEVPTNTPSIFLYFVTEVERSMTGPQLLDIIKEVQKATPDTHTAYIPIWWPHENVSNVAKGIKASAEFSKKYTSSIQHFDTISVFHMPDTTSLKRMIIPMPPFKIAHIKCPFTVIIYDNNKRMPFYFGRITRPRLVDMRATNAGENNEEKPGSAVHWCHFM